MISQLLFSQTFRLTCALLASSFPAVFAVGTVLDRWDSPLVLVIDALVVTVSLTAALVIQRWQVPLIVPKIETRRTWTAPPVGEWTSELPRAVVRRARAWGGLAAISWLGLAGLNAAAAEMATSTFGVAAHVTSGIAAGYLAMMSGRSKVEVVDGTMTSLGIFKDQSALIHRWREVQVAYVGPVKIWAPQADTGRGRGWVIGRCAVLRITR
jgi:hypothetical protein